MKFCLILLLSILISHHGYAEKGIEKLALYKIDSLQHIHVDTILYYRSYCGECIFLSKPPAKINYNRCEIASGYTLTDNFLLYEQNGRYFIIKFDCTNSTIKEEIDSSKSVPYFISIIPILNARDQKLKVMSRRGEFYGPMQMDGGFEDADIYLNKKVQHISMSDTEETDSSFKKYFWINKQIKLLKLIATDVAI